MPTAVYLTPEGQMLVGRDAERDRRLGGLTTTESGQRPVPSLPAGPPCTMPGCPEPSGPS